MATTERAIEEAQVEAFNDSLDEFMRATRRVRGRFAARDGEAGPLSLSQYHHLDPLERAGSLSVGEVAVQAGVAPPTATRMLDALERDGYVVRERPTEGDRRIVHARITTEGRRAVAAKRAQIEQGRRQVFSSLAPAERRQAARVLSSLAAAIEELR